MHGYKWPINCTRTRSLSTVLVLGLALALIGVLVHGTRKTAIGFGQSIELIATVYQTMRIRVTPEPLIDP